MGLQESAGRVFAVGAEGQHAMRAVLLGRPGSGKGTQARRISSQRNIPAISTGDLFRQAVVENTPLGKRFKGFLDQGLLVPDDLVLSIISERLAAVDCKDGFLLDGFPRTIGQAEALSDWLEREGKPLDAALNMAVPDAALVERAMGRRFCASCGASFHVKFASPKQEGICDACGGALAQRADDKDDVVRARVVEYTEKTAPLLGFYRSRGVLIEVDGLGSLAEVAQRIDHALAQRAGTPSHKP